MPTIDWRTKHGKSRTKVYQAWLSMRKRVKSVLPNMRGSYLDRGIGVCPEFASFETFYKEVGDPPTRGHSLHRIDNDKGYILGNIRWATAQEQCENRRRATLIVVPKEFCPRGHAMTEANTFLHRRPNGNLHRECRQCRNAKRRDWWRRGHGMVIIDPPQVSGSN